MTPTPTGEGKTTTTIGLGDALRRIGKRSSICLREPSLGPYFGIKGGGTGAGRAQVVPAEDINLHFVGDMYAVSKANNLLAAMVDNHLQHGNELGIDPRRIVLRRVIDLNDRALREIFVGLGGVKHGVPRQDGFNITPASEVMAILCLASDLRRPRPAAGQHGRRVHLQRQSGVRARHPGRRGDAGAAAGRHQPEPGADAWRARLPLSTPGRSPTSRRAPTPRSPLGWRSSWRKSW